MSNNMRSNYPDLIEKFPDDAAGDKDYTAKVFTVIVQYCVSILFMFISFFLVKKQIRVAPILLPWLLTLGTMLDLPIR